MVKQAEQTNINLDLLNSIKGMEVTLEERTLREEDLEELDIKTKVEVRFHCTPSEKHKLDKFEYKAEITLEELKVYTNLGIKM